MHTMVKRPVLRWFGGKWRLAPWIIGNLPPHRIYTEAYGGAASVLLRKRRSYSEVWNDLDDSLWTLFTVLRDTESATELQRRLTLTPYSRKEYEAAFRPTRNRLEKARRLVVRSFMGFGANSASGDGPVSGFRSKSNLSGTSPCHDWMNYPSLLPAISQRLQGVVIENRPALDVIVDQDTPNTLHYVDPPYLPSTRVKDGQKYSYRHDLTDADHVAMAEVLNHVSGMVALSGYRSELYDRLFGHWLRLDTSTYADDAQPRVECLWLNPAAVRALAQPALQFDEVTA